jgi:hypothetical protein
MTYINEDCIESKCIKSKDLGMNKQIRTSLEALWAEMHCEKMMTRKSTAELKRI